MKDLIDIYTRIKLEEENYIIVSYYHKGIKKTLKARLVSIVKFYCIVLEDDQHKYIIDFIGNNNIIESITIRDNYKPVFYNNIASENLFENGYIDPLLVSELNNLCFGNIDNQKLANRIKFIEQYKLYYSHVKINQLFFSNQEKKEFKEFFMLLLRDLKKECQARGLDSTLKYITSGTTSIIYKIGDRIIKIGKPRRCKQIPYNEFLLQPMINKDYEFDGYIIHIEVTNVVYTPKTVIGEKIFKKYVEWLRDAFKRIGLKCTDLSIENIGILKKENKIDNNNIYFDCGDFDATSIQNNNNLKIKKSSNLVICDLDSLYIVDINKYSHYLTEIGYPKEKIKELVKKHNKLK